MTILITGSTGLLGKELIETAPASYKLITTAHKIFPSNTAMIPLDITNRRQVKKQISQCKPDIIVHCASLGNVDYCQKHQKEAWAVNVEGTRNLVQIAKSINAFFIFFSSNAVFDGEDEQYAEMSKVRPLNFYGQTKVAAENIVWEYKKRSIIFRLNTMYGWNDPKERLNPTTWIIDRLTKHKRTPVVTDVFNNHLWVGQAASSVWKAIQKAMYGELFHIAGKDCMSRYEFCRTVAKVFNLEETLISPVTSDYFKLITPRAKRTCFSTAKMSQLLNIPALSVLEGLTIMKQGRKLR